MAVNVEIRVCIKVIVHELEAVCELRKSDFDENNLFFVHGKLRIFFVNRGVKMCDYILGVKAVIFTSEKLSDSFEKAFNLLFEFLFLLSEIFCCFSRIFHEEKVDGIKEGALECAFDTHI